MKCGLLKTSKLFSKCLLLLSLVLFAGLFLGSNNASAAIVNSSLDQFISTTTITVSGQTYKNVRVYSTGSFTATSSLVGVPDSSYTHTDKTSGSNWRIYQPSYYVGTTGASGLPSGAIIDAVIYSIHAYATSTGTVYGQLDIGANTDTQSIGGAQAITTSPAYFNFQWDSTNLTALQMADLTQANFDLNSTDSSLAIVCSKEMSVDSIERILWYHFDNSVLISRLNSQTISPLNINVYPNVVSSTSTLTTTYYYNSADDTATSTKYTRLQYMLHDNFTNTDQYYLGSALGWTKNTTYATSSISNFCNGGAFVCVNGDTYELTTRFSNDDSSVVSPWLALGSGVYFSYASVGTYNPPSATKFTAFNYSTSTGLLNISFNIATSDAPVLLYTNESNDRDGQLDNQPKYFPFPIGTTTTTGTPVIPNDPSNSGLTYFTVKLVSASDRTLVYDTRVVSVLLASTSASSTPSGGAIIAYENRPCGITELQGCFENAICAIFCPSQGALNIFTAFIEKMKTVPPVGYFYVVKNNLLNISTSSSPVFSIIVPAHFRQYFFSPFDTAIASILWFFFAVHFYKRLKTITV